MFEREVALYRALRPGLRAVTLVTYGGAADLAFSDRLSGIGIICNRRGWSEKWYLRALPLLCRLRRKGEMVFKSNQTIGADVAMDTARRVGARFVARCGYPHAEFAVRMYGEGSPEAEAALELAQSALARHDRFDPIIGDDHQCPVCWVTDGVRSKIVPILSDTAVDWFRCKTCHTEISTE